MVCKGGISTNDFAQILSDFNRTVSYKSVTKTTNAMTGAETSTFGTASDVSVVFFFEDKRYIFDKEGLLDVGDAYVIAPTTLGIKRYDQFTIDGQTFYIEMVIRRHVANVPMCDYATCFKVN